MIERRTAVKLPRRLPDASPRLDLQEPPADPVERERYWLRRADSCCRHHAALTPADASLEVGAGVAYWLPEDLRWVSHEDILERLAELESEAS